MIGLAYVELLLRAANVRAASDDTCGAESGPLPHLVSYPDCKRRSSFAWMANTTEIIPLNVRNRTVHDLSHA